MQTSTAAILLSLTMLAGTLTGCGNSGEQNSSASSSEAASQQTQAGAVQSGATQSGETQAQERKLVIGIQASTFITDYEDNYLTNLVEEELDMEIEWNLLPSDNGELKTKMSLMAASGEELPDIIMTSALGKTVGDEYGAKGTFIDISEYINDASKMPNFCAITGEDKDKMLQVMTSPEGGIYSLTSYQPAFWNMHKYKMYLNMTWLDNVGMEVPTTTEELYEVLKAFCTQDPNGNGILDEIGIYGGSSPEALLNSFIYYYPGINGGLSVDETGETVTAPFIDDAFKEGLIYLNRLYEEGLLEASLFTDDSTQQKVILNNADANLTGFMTTASYSVWTDANNNDNFKDMHMIAPVEGPDGVAWSPIHHQEPTQIFYITSDCENVDLAIEFADYFYSDEMYYTSRFGEEGVDWSVDPELCSQYTNILVNAGAYDAITAVYINNIWPEQTNKYWRNVNPCYSSGDRVNTRADGTTMKKDAFDSTAHSNVVTAENYECYNGKQPQYLLPTLYYTSEESDICADIIADISSYIEESIAEFTTGVRDVESDWDNYLKEINNMGLADWLECAQAAYDRTK